MNAEAVEEKSPFQIQREKVAAVIAEWQSAESVDDGPWADADALTDYLADAGLKILPIAPDCGRYVVEVDGKPAAFPGSTHTGPMDANDAIETVVAEESAAYEDGEDRAIVMRPATESEQVASVWTGITGEQR